jgi:hypothetical protein
MKTDTVQSVISDSVAARLGCGRMGVWCTLGVCGDRWGREGVSRGRGRGRCVGMIISTCPNTHHNKDKDIFITLTCKEEGEPRTRRGRVRVRVQAIVRKQLRTRAHCTLIQESPRTADGASEASFVTSINL